MRTSNLIENGDASTQLIGEYEIDCGQDMRWLLTIKSSGLDGIPKAFIEESLNNEDWLPINNHADFLDHFPLSDEVIGIRDSYFMGKYIRVRIEPNGNTTGTIDSILAIKTKST